MTVKYFDYQFSKHILFSRTLQESPPSSSALKACANPE